MFWGRDMGGLRGVLGERYGVIWGIKGCFGRDGGIKGCFGREMGGIKGCFGREMGGD